MTAERDDVVGPVLAKAAEQPESVVVPSRRLQFRAQDNGALRARWGARETDGGVLRRNAFLQVASRAGIPRKFAETLMGEGEWRRRLLVHNLNELYGHAGGRQMLRVCPDGTVGGILSPSFARVDVRANVDAFVAALGVAGAVPVRGYVRMDTRLALQAVHGETWVAAVESGQRRPLEHGKASVEAVRFGVLWQGSAYGDGGHCVRFFSLRMECGGVALGEDLLDQLPPRERYSERATAAVGAVTRAAFLRERVQAYRLQIRRAQNQPVGPEQALSIVRKLGLTQDEQQTVLATFRDNRLPLWPDFSAWRLSNALGWVAQHTTDERRRLHLEALAGRVLPVVDTRTLSLVVPAAP